MNDLYYLIFRILDNKIKYENHNITLTEINLNSFISNDEISKYYKIKESGKICCDEHSYIKETIENLKFFHISLFDRTNLKYQIDKYWVGRIYSNVEVGDVKID